MEIKDIVTLMEAVAENGLTSFKLEAEGTFLSIKREKEQIVTAVPAPVPGLPPLPVQPAALVSPAAPVPAAGETAEPAPAAAAPAGEIGADHVVTSPLVGTFYAAPSPDAENFVKVGDTVKKGQVLGIIEAMKLMNEIESEFDGVVEAILVNNEEVVEYGQPLFRIK